MKPNSYPEPPPFQWDPYPVRVPLPVYPPTEPLPHPLPSLPSPPRQPNFSAPYTLTTHLFPACYLRSTRPAPVPTPPSPSLSKDERKQFLKETRKELDRLRTFKETDGYPRVLWNCVNRYVKNGLNEKQANAGVTLFFAHANGFPKEIFEPTLAHLLSSPAAAVIDEVWVWESIQHGDAALINAPSASGLFDWQDNGRDISNFLLYFMPSSSTASTLPTHLPRVSTECTATRARSGFASRNLIAIGHSYGGCTSALAAILYPSLFKALYLIDPVILSPTPPPPLPAGTTPSGDLALGALSRRDGWESREEALASFSQNPFFKAWDPEVLKIYIECGTHFVEQESGKRTLRLKMPGVQEAVVFVEVHTEKEVFHLLGSGGFEGLSSSEKEAPDSSQKKKKTIDDIPIRWCVPGKPGARELRDEVGGTQQRVWLRSMRSHWTGRGRGVRDTNVRILGGGHLIPQEAPKELADDLGEYILELSSSEYPSSISPSDTPRTRQFNVKASL
ncbi:Abhydrolase domain-containing protein mpaH [Psilocybe cubensis]|uniref:Abhydrolase domain-containing protein mpaH n=2 Tax=Psilocybe cubensis TaxID=181762 RepID=A0ACB8GGZ0_PSICU|nr:Abhydrolase domain-containing protein mpaH [Psilocybe cubensis]KAH9474764.1 Abhydrolase domain-containing protein mpaH [Psilocybe cubensis]